MARTRGASTVVVVAALMCLGPASLVHQGFVAVQSPRAPTRVLRGAYQTGKVNLGMDISLFSSQEPPMPHAKLNQGIEEAIAECVQEGCSVNALMELDQKIAADEALVEASIAELQAQQKTRYSRENAKVLAGLRDFLGRSAGLRSQVGTLRGIHESNFVRQLVKALSFGFGGGRPTDYPKVGVMAYSA